MCRNKKYRIKHVAYHNGNEKYFVQKRFLFWWFDLKMGLTYRTTDDYVKESVGMDDVEDAKYVVMWLSLDKRCTCMYGVNEVVFCLKQNDDTLKQFSYFSTAFQEYESMLSQNPQEVRKDYIYV